MKKVLTAFFVSLLCFCLPFYAFAEAIPSKPATEHDFYVLDNAEVLSEETETAIVSANQSLRSDMSAEIVVITVKTTDGADAFEYAKELGELWGVGSKNHKNGMVLLLAVEDKTAAVALGEGFSKQAEKAEKILTESVMPLIKDKKYDSAVLTGFSMLLTLARDSKVGAAAEYYSFVDFRANSAGGMSKTQISPKTTVAVVCFVAVLFLAVAALAVLSSGKYRQKFATYRIFKKR